MIEQEQLCAYGAQAATSKSAVDFPLPDPSTRAAERDDCRIVFLTSLDDQECRGLLAHLGNVVVVRDLAALKIASGDLLLSFGTSVIVASEILERFSGRAYNLHAASPAYPGRDPHHWAVHDQVSRYGATLHIMTERVDDGPIVDVEWFDVPPGTRPDELLAAANQAALRIIQRVGPRLQKGGILPALPGIGWTGKKRTRRDFIDMCKIEPDISYDEFEERFQSFDGGRYDNLYVTIHGWTFRIDKKVGPRR